MRRAVTDEIDVDILVGGPVLVIPRMPTGAKYAGRDVALKIWRM